MIYLTADVVQIHLLELLSVFLTEKQIGFLRLAIVAEPRKFEVCRKHLTMSKYAAAAFREGRVQLDPDWNIERRPREDLKSTCRVRAEPQDIIHYLADGSSQYILWATMPVLIPLPITSQGHALRCGSDIEMMTQDPESAPLPSAFLLGIHRRFCNSLKSFEIDREILVKRPPKISTQWISRIRQACSARAFPLARWIWSNFPRQGRIWVYRLLLRVGASMYEKPNF